MRILFSKARFATILISVAALLLGACAAPSQTGTSASPAARGEPYRIGMTAALTGPFADTYAPVYEAINVYFQQLNDQGGINGHPVRILIEDDAADATKATSNATKLIQQEKVALLTAATLSATYGSIVNISRSAGTPVLIASVCPTEAYPPADPLVFCTASFGALYDGTAAVQFIKEAAKGPVKLALVGIDSPIVRTNFDHVTKLASESGMQVVTRQLMPPTATDYTPFATQVQQASADWVFAWSPWSSEIGPFDALQKLGWKGNYLLWAHQPAEEELTRRKADTLYAIAGNALFAEDLPVHKQIRAAAQKYKTSYPIEYMAEGWVTAQVLDQALRAAGSPADSKAVQGALAKLSVETQGLRGGPLVFTADNHFRTRAWYKIYRWDSQQNKMVTARDWVGLDVAPSK